MYKNASSGKESLQEAIFMVKGNSRQVIVVNAPDQKLFEQAIFILRDGVVRPEGITDEALLKEAKQYINIPRNGRGRPRNAGPLWAFGGAAATGLLWLMSMM